jgi:amino acid adenylation domain-containing protein
MPSSTLDSPQAAAPEMIFFPASFAQQSLWFIDQLTPGMATYNTPSALRIRGKLEIEVLEKTVKEIVRRHETLRTRFVAVRGEPQQIIEDQVSVQLPVLDLTCVDGDEEREAEAIRLAREEAREPFDLQQAPLMRVKVLRLGVRDHVLLFNMHHIICDAWSTGVLAEEVSVIYSAFCAGQPSPLPELPIQYADYTMWQRERLQGQVLEQQLSYWKRQLAGSNMLQLPTDRPRPPLQSQNGALFDFLIAANLTQQLKILADEQGATFFMLLVAAFQTLLYRYSGQNDIAVGTPIAGRRRSETEKLIGFFINTLVLRGDLSGPPSFTELLWRTKEVTLEAYAHQDVPFEKLVEVLSPERNLASTPLFQVMITLQNAPQSGLQLGAAILQPFNNVDNGTSKFDLLLQLAEDGSGMLTGSLQYNTDLFEAASVTRMIDHYRMLLGGIVAKPRQSIDVLPLLTANERKQVIDEWNQTTVEFPRGKCLPDLIEEQAARTPEAIALEHKGQTLTYRELNERANHLGHYLQILGVGPEIRVGICVERSLDMIVGLLGILKAGGAYVPLDPSYPAERLGYMLKDSQAAVLLTQQPLLSQLPSFPGTLVRLDEQWPEISVAISQNPQRAIAPENLAYVMYTSGSTGLPKGVAICHSSAVAFQHWAQGAFAAEDLAGVLASTSICFDLSVFEIFVPLACGGRTIVVRNALDLVGMTNAMRVKLVNTVPSAMRELVRLNAVPESARTINLAGEALHSGLVQEIYEIKTVEQLFNLYGPSEDTTYSTYALIPRRQDAIVTIGKPLANTQVFVLDEELQPVPIGIVGQLHIGGSGLARGYLNRTDLTADRFRPNPFSSVGGERLYQTGDLARYRADGNLEFLGRLDHQVKLRGYRIELGEIEAALKTEERVRQAVVIVLEDTPGDKRLVAYVVPNREITTGELRDALKRRIPEYMVPSNFVMMEALPLTPNGKLNRAALPVPVIESTNEISGFSVRRPRATLEELLAQIWIDVLRLKRVGVHDDFFALGGHSLLATQAVARIRSVFHIDLPLRRLFEEPTVAGLAKVIEQQMQQGTIEKTPPLVRVSRDGPLPLSYGQQRLWFVHQLAPDSAAYNIAGSVRSVGPFDIELFNRALTEILRRHESFRTRFIVVDQEPRQVIDEAKNFELQVIDMTSYPPEERVEETRRQARKESQRPFDLARDPLLRVRVWRLAEDDHVLHINMHHIASDAWSLGVFVREFSLLYDAFGRGEASPLPEMPFQYADFSVWQREWLAGEVLEQQLTYWKKQLAGSTTLELPTDRPHSASASYRGAATRFNLSKQLADQIRDLGRRNGTTLYMTLLAAFQVLLLRWSGQHDITLGTPIAGRRQTEAEGMIGFFVNVLAMRTDLSGGPTFVQLLRRVKEVTLEAYAHQEVSFEKLVEALAPERDPSRSPFFQVMFFLQNAPMTDLRLGEKNSIELFAAGTAAVKFDLTVVFFQETADGLSGSAQYNTDLFDAATIAGMVEQYQTLLAGIAANPEQSIETYSLLPEAAYERLLDGWNHPLEQEEQTVEAVPA